MQGGFLLAATGLHSCRLCRVRRLLVSEYDDLGQEGKDRVKGVAWPKVVAVLIGLAVTLGALYCLLWRPDIYVETMRHLENREGYAKEAEQAKKKADALGRQVAELKEQLSEGDSFARSLQAELDAVTVARDGLQSTVSEKDGMIAGLNGTVEGLQAENGKLKESVEGMTAKLDGWEAGLLERWHFSFGGYLTLPLSFDGGFHSSATAIVGFGKGRWQALAGAGIDTDGDASISIGCLYTL